MKKLCIGISIFTLCFITHLSLAWAQKATGPKMVLKEKTVDYKEVDEGEVIEHVFKVLNEGDQPLQIEKVKPGWGCAVAHFDKTIPPGGEGKITLRVNTKNYQGKITKTANVYSNDPGRRIEALRITAFVKVPIYISTRYVYLRGMAGQTAARTVQIKAELDKPLKLEPTHFDLSSKVIFKIEELEVGKRFLIRFSNIPGSAETYHGVLKLRTNYPEKPEIAIRVRGKFTVQKSSIPSKTPTQKSQK